MNGAARLVLIPLLLVVTGAAAVEGLQLGLARLIAPWGGLEGVELRLDSLDADGARFGLTIERITLPEPLARARLSLDCPELTIDHARIHCPVGRLNWTESPLGPLQLTTTFEFLPADDRLNLTLKGDAVAGGRLDLRLVRSANAWRVDGTLNRADTATLIRWASLFTTQATRWCGEGRASLRFDLHGEGASPRQADVRLGLERAALESDDGEVAAAGLSGRLDLRAETAKAGHAIRGELTLDAGELYAAPLYWQAAERPLTGRFELVHQEERLEIKRLAWNDPGVAVGEGRGVVVREEGRWRPRHLELELERAEAAPAYARYLQPWVADHHLLGQLEMEGGLGGTLHWDDGQVQWSELRFDRFFIDDPLGRFGLYDLSGELGWSQQSAPRESDLRWAGGHLFALELGESALRARAAKGRLSLLEPLDQPLLDGTLLVDTLELTLAQSGEPQWALDVVLTPVTMERLAHALGWPPMSGQLSGVIPRLAYRDGRMTVGGDLLARLFDGEVLVRDLVLEEPFAPINRLDAELELRRLDLALLTEAFAFGSIQGRLEGEVKELRLEQWQPVAFDAYFATPDDDDGRRRISQRAVENLSRLGGGMMGGALSKGLLGLFEEFGYDRIGVGCTLREGVCRMRGAGPANGGYYLVKGGGLPRIDVIGYAREVDWDELLSRLRGVTFDNPQIR